MAQHFSDEGTASEDARPSDRSRAKGAEDRGVQEGVERRLIDSRRQACGLAPSATGTVGLALSGGGIRSATFGLGVLQALARADLLPRVDYLSTVSGGGYVGSFLGALLRAPTRPPLAKAAEPVPQGYALAKRVLQGDLGEREFRLAACETGSRQTLAVFHPVRWLREAGRYLAPTQSNDWLYAIAFYLRSLAGVHFVAAVAIVLAFCIWAALWLAVPPLRAYTVVSPMWWLVAALGFITISIALAYWPTAPREEAFERRVSLAVLTIFGLAGAVGALGLWWHGTRTWAVAAALLAGLCLAAFVVLQLAERKYEHIEKSRRKLTSWLSRWLTWTLVLAAAAAVDALARWLYFRDTASASLYSTVLGVLVLLGGLLRAFQPKETRALASTFKHYMAPIALVLAIAIVVSLATGYAMLVYAAFDAYRWRGVLPFWGAFPATAWFLFALTAVAFAGLMFRPRFLNLSTFHNFYAARLTRAYLGGANFDRLKEQQHGEMKKKFWVQQTQKHDLWTLAEYYGLNEAGSVQDAADSCYPIHLVNTTLNEQKGGTSGITQRDRKGVILTIGPAGMTVDRRFYAWSDPVESPNPAWPASKTVPHLLDANRELKLGNWLAISGAAISSGVGAQTRLGFAMLATLFNVRLGYWWEALPGMREGGPLTAAERLQRSSTYGCLYAELTGGFWGRRSERWYLSDGGHFENTGLYALIERRVSFIIAVDSGADPEYAFKDWGNLVRKARIDFGADVQVLTRKDLDGTLPASIRPLFGTLADFTRKPEELGTDQPCAMLAQVSFEDDREQPLTVLVLKPALVDRLPSDLLDYARRNPRFPQEATSDQFYDEEQWESYRALGELIGNAVFGAGAQQHEWAPVSVAPLAGHAPVVTAVEAASVGGAP